MQYSDQEKRLAELQSDTRGADGTGIGDMKLSGLLTTLVTCLSARDVASALAEYIGDERVRVAVHEKLSKVK